MNMTLSSLDKDSPVLIVISTPGSNRGDRLKLHLRQKSGFRLRVLDAVMISHFSQIQDPRISPNGISKTLLRPVLPSEIGCSASHNLARRIIADDIFGGVILEDDAEVESIDLLLEVTEAFLRTQRNSRSVLSLTTTIGADGSMQLNNRKTRFYRLCGTPALAQGYVLTPAAAEELYNANTPIRFLADWPISRTRFFAVNRKIIRQPNEIPLSTIDPYGDQRGRLVNLTQQKILMYIGYYYLINAEYFSSIKSYFKEMIMHRFLHHIDQVLVRIYGIRERSKL